MNRITGRYLEVEPGVEIYFEDQGSGQPIVFIPGWTMTTEVFQKQAQYFSSKYRVIRMDPRSQGRSTKTQYGNNYRQQAKDLGSLIDALNLKDVILCGWSTGDLVIWNYVEQRGTGNIKAMVPIDMTPVSLSHDPEDWVEGTLEEVSEAYTQLLFEPKGQRGYFDAAEEIMFTKPRDADLCAWVVDESAKTPFYIASSLFADAMFSNTMKGAQQADKEVPQLIFIAEHWADIAVKYMNKHCPNTKTHVIGGHMAFFEHHEEFNKVFEEFIESI